MSSESETARREKEEGELEKLSKRPIAVKS
jgi:hypothetical protein